MSDKTKIEWADATANYVNGCSVVSKGCTNCYAMRLAGTRLKHHPSRAGLTIDTKAGPVWNGKVRRNEKVLREVMGWKKPRRIFWNAHGDLFHESVPDEWIDAAFAVMALTPQHIHMVLTKRPERMRDYFGDIGGTQRADWVFVAMARQLNVSRLKFPQWPLQNVWLGTSVEDQAAADERIPHLLATPAAVRFLSCEPLLGPVDLGRVSVGPNGVFHNVVEGIEWDDLGPRQFLPYIDWLIVGGESGPRARPMHPDWARSLRDQCAVAGVPFHFKQWGEFIPCIVDDRGDGLVCLPDAAASPAFENGGRHPIITDHGTEFWRVGKGAAGRLLDDVQHDGVPA